MPADADPTIETDGRRGADKELPIMKNWVLGLILVGVAVVMYVSIFVELATPGAG
jgi:hypothetical protein